MRGIVDSIARWDMLWLTAIVRLHGRRLLDRLMRSISWSASGFGYPLLAGFLLAVTPPEGRMLLAAGLIAFSIELPLYKVIKQCVKRNRPCEALPGVEARARPGDQFSFPSGHSAAAVLVATLLGHSFPFLYPIAGAWALAVGFSRVYLGVHYPSDVLAGMALGILSAWAGIAVVW
jgi:undecaprenyl-diphosphatase